MNPQKPNYAANVVNQTVDFGGYRWKGNPGQDWQLAGRTGQPGADTGQASSFGANVTDPIESARKLREFTIESNRPQVESLQKSTEPLKARYDEILNSIKGQQKTSEERQTRVTNAELGRRGIGGGGYYDQELANAVQPITSQYAGLSAQTGLAQQQDLNTIAQQIAGLQSGNPESAMSGALNILGQQNQAQQFTSAQAAQQQAQQANLAEQARQFNLQSDLARQQYSTEAGYKSQTFPLELALLQNQVKKANAPQGAGLFSFLQQPQSEQKPTNQPFNNILEYNQYLNQGGGNRYQFVG